MSEFTELKLDEFGGCEKMGRGGGVVGWWGVGRMMGDGSGYRGGGWAWFSGCREVVVEL